MIYVSWYGAFLGYGVEIDPRNILHRSLYALEQEARVKLLESGYVLAEDNELVLEGDVLSVYLSNRN